MLNLRKFILAAAVTVMSLFMLTGCKREEDKSQYAHLKTDIVGAWCDEAGPEAVETQGGTALRFYEFTESGEVVYYFVYEDMGAVFSTGSYTIDGNIFDSEGSKCRINVEDDILTMTHDAGSSRYKRVSAAELLEYNIYAQGEALYAEELPLIMAQQGGASGETGSGDEAVTADTGGNADSIGADNIEITDENAGGEE